MPAGSPPKEIDLKVKLDECPEDRTLTDWCVVTMDGLTDDYILITCVDCGCPPCPDIDKKVTSHLNNVVYYENEAVPVTYEITVRNLHDCEAKSVIVKDRIPDETTFVSATPAPSSNTGKLYEWDLSPMGPKSTKTIELTVELDHCPDDRTLTDWCEVTMDEEFVDDHTLDTHVECECNLVVIKTQKLDGEDPTCVKGGDEVTYDICVTNPCPTEVTDVTITEELHKKLRFVSCTGGCKYNKNTHTVTWWRSDLAAGKTWPVDLTVEVDASVSPCMELISKCTVTCNEKDHPAIVFNRTPVCCPPLAGSRPEFDTVGCDATNYFVIGDKIKQLVIDRNVNSYGQKINLWSDFWDEYFSTTAGELYPDKCFPGYDSALTDPWNQGVYEWNIVLQMKPESDINLNIVDCVMEHNQLDIWNNAEQTGQYRASWGELFFVPAANPMVTAEAIPGPYATPGFEESFTLDGRTHPALNTVPLLNAHYTSKAFWEEGIIIALPETGTTNSQGQSVYNLKNGDNIRVTIEIPTSNTVDIHYGPDNVILKYVGIIGTEYVTEEPCAE
jgi:uncharacterized repeat protein (TIGR01451 family)